jgi:hypothetical protein
VPVPGFGRRRGILEENVNDTQLYLAIGLPVFAVMINILTGVLQHSATGARFTSIDSRFTSLESKFTNLESNINGRFNALENRFLSLEARFDTLTGKVVEVDNRLTRVEAILDRH